MNKLMMLTRVLFKNGGNPFSTSGGKKKGLSLIVLILAFSPIVIFSTYALMKAYDTLYMYHLEGAVMSIILSASCFVMLVLGILYVISIYYFADDVSMIITMPIKPEIILGSKFVIVTVYEYAIEMITVLPALIAYGIKINTILYWVYSVVLFIVLPIIPVALCSIISMLIMAFGKFFKNKDRIKLIGGILGLVFAIGLQIGIQALNGNGSGMNTNFLINNSAVIKKSSAIFPSSRLATMGILNSMSLNGLFNILAFIAVSAAFVLLFMLLSDKLYLRGVVGLTQSSSKGKKLSSEGIKKASRSKSQLFTCAQNEWRGLYRSPSYFLNCIITEIIMAVVLVIMEVSLLRSLPVQNSLWSQNTMFVAIASIIISIFCSMNFICATAVSREGKNFYVTRYIPVDYKTQIFAKFIPGFLISTIPLVIIIVISLFVTSASPISILLIFITSFLELASFNMIGLITDIYLPKLDWDDEAKAVKQNFNSMIQMLISIIVEGLIVFVAIKLNLDFKIGSAFVIVVNAALCVALYGFLMTTGVKVYSDSRNYIDSSVESGKKKIDKKTLNKIIRIGCTVVFIVIFGAFMFMDLGKKTEISISSKNISISGGLGEGTSFKTSDIKEVYMKDSIPEASKIEGTGTSHVRRGYFNVNGMGKGHLYIEDASKGPFVYIILKNGFVIIEFKDSSVTNKYYDKFKIYGSR